MTITVKTNPSELAPYLKDASHFQGFGDELLFPETEKDISDILRSHHKNKIPVTVT